MSVAVYVMPLTTWLEGSFRTFWGPENPSPPRFKRSVEQVLQATREFGELLDRLLPSQPELSDTGPALSATIYSVEGFARPFDLAQRWSYRLKLPRLCALWEPPQIWLPWEFEHAFRVAAPWRPESEVAVASAAGVFAELERLQAEILKAENPELDETDRVAGQLRASAALAVEHGMPAIVES